MEPTQWLSSPSMVEYNLAVKGINHYNEQAMRTEPGTQKSLEVDGQNKTGFLKTKEYEVQLD